MKRTDQDLLADIREAIAAIRRHQPASRDEMVANELVSTFIHKKLEIIGEAASRLSPETCAGAVGIPWRSIIGLRNRLIHDYTDVDWDIVWDVVSNELAPLDQQVEGIQNAREMRE